jgi:hypothetical protein
LRDTQDLDAREVDRERLDLRVPCGAEARNHKSRSVKIGIVDDQILLRSEDVNFPCERCEDLRPEHLQTIETPDKALESE